MADYNNDSSTHYRASSSRPQPSAPPAVSSVYQNQAIVVVPGHELARRINQQLESDRSIDCLNISQRLLENFYSEALSQRLKTLVYVLEKNGKFGTVPVDKETGMKWYRTAIIPTHRNMIALLISQHGYICSIGPAPDNKDELQFTVSIVEGWGIKDLVPTSCVIL